MIAGRLGRSFLASLVKALAFACALGAAPAGATTLCVPDFDPERCPDNGSNVAILNLETAMSTDASDASPDRIVVAPGTYTDSNSFTLAGADPLTIEGAGAGGAADPGATRLITSSSSNVIVVNLATTEDRPVTMRDLTVVAPASLPDNFGAAMQIEGSTLERVDIEIANLGSDGISSTPGGGVYRDGEIYPVGGGAIRDAITTGTPGSPGQLLVQGAEIVEPQTGVASEEEGLPVSVEQTVIEHPTHTALMAWKGGRIDARNSIVVADGDATAMEARTNTAVASTATGNHLTIVQESPGMGTGVSSWAESTAEANLLLENSILRGFGSTYLRLGANAPAVLTIRYSNFEPTGTDLAQGALDIAERNIDSDPAFASPPPYDSRTGLALLAGSPSIDAGDPAPGGLAADFLGAPRPLDGDGDGDAIRDQGAFEAPGLPSPAGDALKDTAVTLELLGKRLRVNRRGVARLRVRCPAAEQSPPCAGTLILRSSARSKGGARSARRRRVVLARARFSVAAGRTKAVKLRIRRSKLRLLRRDGRARRVLAIARVRDGAGNRSTVRRRLRAVLAARPRR